MIKNLIIIVTMLFGSLNHLIAQQNTFDTIVKDFNKDRVVDTLINYYESGSYCGGRTIEIINGKTKTKTSLDNYGCYGTFTKKIRVPEDLTLTSNRLFLNAFEEKLLPKKRDNMDSSLKWLISGELNVKRLDSDSLFDLITSPKTNWQPNTLVMPESYYVNIAGDTLQKLSPSTKEVANTKKGQGYLVYYTIGHHIVTLDSLAPVVENKDYKIYTTDHAIYVKKGNAYRWTFISDANVTGAPGKHRWVSIKQVQLIDHYLIIHQDVPPDNVYNIQIVNIETQKVGRLNCSPSYNNWSDEEEGMYTFKIIDNLLVFTEYGEPELKKMQVKKIFDALDAY